MTASNDPLWRLPAGVETRWSSPENKTGQRGAGGMALRGRKGSPWIPLKAGEACVLAEVSGRSGTVRRIWATLDRRGPEVLRGLRIRIFWDGADEPAVDVPWGDFFGQTLGRCVTFESALFSNPEGRSFNCVVPMPFRTGMKIVVTNEGADDIAMFFYDVDYTLGDRHAEDMLYFHAHWRREAPTTIGRDFAFLPEVTGAGRFLGASIGVVVNREQYGSSWWGEGECKIYLDDDQAHPSLCGTGTEDFIGTAWGLGAYCHLYQGAPVVEPSLGLYGFYRLHVPDPVYFRKSVRVTMQQIGVLFPAQAQEIIDLGTEVHSIYEPDGPLDLEAFKTGSAPTLFERSDDWSACAYFYLDRPTNDLPALAEARSRIDGLPQAPGANARMDR